jgi:hypothetical protein
MYAAMNIEHVLKQPEFWLGCQLKWQPRSCPLSDPGGGAGMRPGRPFSPSEQTERLGRGGLLHTGRHSVLTRSPRCPVCKSASGDRASRNYVDAYQIQPCSAVVIRCPRRQLLGSE